MRHWYSRYRISNAIDEGTLAALRGGGHVSRCAACQAYARDLEALDGRLARGAGSAPAPAVRARRPLRIAAPLALAAAAVVALVVAARRTPVPVEQVASTRPAAMPVLDVRDLAGRVSALVAMSDAPLDAELRDLIRDGRRGLDTVVARSGLRR
jgi:hypothetical protein